MVYEKICDGVFKVNEKGNSVVLIEGQNHYRLMDFFYTAVPADELSSEQVSKLCQARVKEERCFQGANKAIKELFNSFLKIHNSKSVLEVGAGTNPILTEEEAENYGINYIKSDADDKYQDLSCHFDENADLPNKNFDVVIALFVLHFKFYPHQIEEIFKHIKDDGIFLANVYNRSDESRILLISDFENAGFKVNIIKDPKNSCRDNYYLMASKREDVIQDNKDKLLFLIE